MRDERDAERKRARAIVRSLAREYPNATCALRYESPLQLLIATILSAQCTDEQVNLVTPVLFARYPDAASLAGAELADVESIIRSTGFYRNKAKSIQGACRLLVEKYGGQVPRRIEELLELPGVARKTANVVLGTAFGIASGVVVDTHVARISGRLGLTADVDPKKIETALAELLPRSAWIDFSHRVIWHGRRVCNARKPLCDQCCLARWCPKIGVGEQSRKVRKTGAKKRTARKEPSA